jgi:hypothetical protein
VIEREREGGTGTGVGADELPRFQSITSAGTGLVTRFFGRKNNVVTHARGVR